MLRGIASARGKLIQAVRPEDARKSPVVRSAGNRRQVLRLLPGHNLELIAVIGATLPGESFHPQQIITRLLEAVHQIRIGGLANNPCRLVVVRNSFQARGVEPACSRLIDGE